MVLTKDLFRPVNLPRITSPTSSRKSLNDHDHDHSPLPPGRRTCLLNPYMNQSTVEPIRLKLPSLDFQQPTMSHAGDRDMRKVEKCSNSGEQNPKRITLPKLPNIQKGPKGRTVNPKKAERLTVEMDMKLSSVQQSFENFEKKQELVKHCLQDAVRRSKEDAATLKHKARKSTPTTDGFVKSTYQKYFTLPSLDILHDQSTRKVKRNATAKSAKTIETLPAIGDNVDSDYGSSMDIALINDATQKMKTKRGLEKIAEETFSHRMRKEAQVIKRMEIRSTQGRTPHRVDELNMEGIPSSVNCFRSRRGVPRWMKDN